VALMEANSLCSLFIFIFINDRVNSELILNKSQTSHEPQFFFASPTISVEYLNWAFNIGTVIHKECIYNLQRKQQIDVIKSTVDLNLTLILRMERCLNLFD
jgi:hypothetical protein